MAGEARMRNVSWLAAWGSVILLAVTGCSSAARTSMVVPAGSTPLVSYVDVTSAYPDLGEVARSTGQRWYALSFLLAADGICAPTWGGTQHLGDPAITSAIGTVRAAGGQISVASGGELGAYLENTCQTPAALASSYAAALTATGTDRLDLDIEQPVPVGLVADAASLLTQQRSVSITITVPVADATSGLSPSAIALLRALATNGVTVTVNAMLLDFDHDGSWQEALLGAADTVSRQLTALWPATPATSVQHRLGLTLMAGRDDMGTVTSLADARAVRDYARARGLAMLGLWSLARDNGGCPGRPTAADDCSGIAQQPYEFASVLSGREP